MRDVNAGTIKLNNCAYNAIIGFSLIILIGIGGSIWGTAILHNVALYLSEKTNTAIYLAALVTTPVLIFGILCIFHKLSNKAVVVLFLLIFLISLVLEFYYHSLGRIVFATSILSLLTGAFYYFIRAAGNLSRSCLVAALFLFIYWLNASFLPFMGAAASFRAVIAGPYYIKTLEKITPRPFFDKPHRVEFISTWKERPIVYVCRTGNLESLKYLLSQGYKLEKPTDPFKCIVHAVHKKDFEMIDYLLSLPEGLRPSEENIIYVLESYPDFAAESTSLMAFKEKL